MRFNRDSFFDRPASSLLLNFLQLPVFTPSRSSFCTYVGNADTANWMGRLAKECPESPRTLMDLVIPGTHNSASASIKSWKPFSAVGRTQSLSILEQLELGARYLDIRIAPSSKGGDDFSIWHGILEGCSLGTVLDDINEFMSLHPTEVVLLELVPEFGKKFEGSTKQRCMDQVYATVGHRVIPGRQVSHIVQRVPFSRVSLSNSESRLAVILHDRMFSGDFGLSDDEVMDTYGFVRGQAVLQNSWHNTRDLDELFNRNLDFVEKQSQERNSLTCSQFLCTPGVSSAREFLGVLTGDNSLRPVSHACKLYKDGTLGSFFCERQLDPWNIVSLDFFDLCPDVIHFLIGMNWQPYKLEVGLALASTAGIVKDVTSCSRSLVRRGCVLFSANPGEDLGVSEEQFTLFLGYSVTDGDGFQCHYFAEIDAHCDSSIVVSPFSSNLGIRVMDLSSKETECKSKGILRCSEELVVSYNVNELGCAFEVVGPHYS